ncbi:hypothetical protein K438DRAFT_1926112 [Mycena galopus ATCC 62051]|nr:hypothetical protein K438DRAFT_1926112 [Mycena galopus ATCC 62051]
MAIITPFQASLAGAFLESCLFGILLVLFISTIYFMATRRTLAGSRQTAKHHFLSTVFIGVTVLFLTETAHWIAGIYHIFAAFAQSGDTTIPPQSLNANPTGGVSIVNTVSLVTAILVGDSLMIYRLWIIWAPNQRVLILPIGSLTGVVVAGIGILHEFAQSKSTFATIPFLDRPDLKPWVMIGFVLSLVTSLYSTTFIAFRILKFDRKPLTNSSLTFFLVILVESAALQTFWLVLAATTIIASGSNLQFPAAGSFPVILGISNVLIHARIGLGWSHESVGTHSVEQPGYENAAGSV